MALCRHIYRRTDRIVYSALAHQSRTIDDPLLFFSVWPIAASQVFIFVRNPKNQLTTHNALTRINLDPINSTQIGPLQGSERP